MNIIETLEREEIARVSHGKRIPDFAPGDTLSVNVKVVEGDRTRIQAYEGVCIGRSGAGLNESFTVRKISYGEGVERVFPLYSPMIDSIEVVRRGKVRRAKLYYLRARRGKKARIGEKQDFAAEMGDSGPVESAETAPPAEPLPEEPKVAETKAAEPKTKAAEPKAREPKAKAAAGKAKAAEAKGQ